MKTIGSLIHRRLNRMLLVSLGTATLCLLAYSAFSFKQTEKQAVNFVMNHVAALAQAGVNSQNVNEIDKEIGRFTATWKETQDLDLRVDVFLDDRHIGHAGQLQPFRHFDSGAEKRLQLPSGQELRVVVQISLTNFLLFGLALLGCFGFFIVGVFYILKRSMAKSIAEVTGPLESRIAWLKALTVNLPQSAHEMNSFDLADVQELDDLGVSIQTLGRQIVALESDLSEASFNHWRIKLADHVAHNVKNAIATLQIRVRALAISEKERRDLLATVDSLRDVASNLLASRRADKHGLSSTSPANPTHILAALKSATDHQVDGLAAKGIELVRSEESAVFGKFCSISQGELQSVISNIVDNSVDAIENKGRIELEFEVGDQHLDLLVRDNGIGIPANVLGRLTEEGFTYGKKNGNGIGLFHAKQALSSVGGALLVSSNPGEGTTVTLRIPLIAPPQSFASELMISPDCTVVVVDDDPSIHAAWKVRLAPWSGAINFVNLSSVSEFKCWFQKVGTGDFGSRVYLFDFDLMDKDGTGLDIIEEFGLAFESTLVSGMAEDDGVVDRCERLKVRRLSKEYLAFVPVRFFGETHLADPLTAVI